MGVRRGSRCDRVGGKGLGIWRASCEIGCWK